MDALLGLSFGILLTLFLLYLLPTFIAFARGHRNRVPILLVNIFLGWSFLGWLVALIWSFTSNTKSNAANQSNPVTAGVASSVVINVAQSNGSSGRTSANGSEAVPSSAVARVANTPDSVGVTMSAQPPPIPKPEAIEQTVSQSKQWFYQTSGEKRGPVTADEMVRRIRVGSLDRGAMVWTEGFPAWTAIEATELGAHVSVAQSTVVSAAVGQEQPRVEVNNTVVWILAFAPILGVVLEAVVAFIVYGGNQERVLESVNGSSFWYVTLALNSILCLVDAKNLEQADVDEGLFKWVLLVPVYIFKRARAVGDDLSYFVTWFVSVVIAAVLLTSVIPTVIESMPLATGASTAIESPVEVPAAAEDVDAAAAEAERATALAEAERMAASQQQQREYEEALQVQRQAEIDAYTQKLQAEATEASATNEQVSAPVESLPAESIREASPVVVLPSTSGPGARITEPKYPSASRRAGEEGTVGLQVYVLKNGKPGEVRLLESSGFEKLDEAAIREVERKWRFVPGTEDGKPVAMWHDVAVTFRRTD